MLLRHRRRRRPLVGLVALTVLTSPVLAACSSADPGPSAAPASAAASAGPTAGPGSEPAADSAADGDAALLVRSAAQQTNATSSKVVLTSRTQLQGQDVQFSGEGAFDPQAKTGTFTFSLPNGGGKIEERILGEDLYLALPQQPGAFYKVSLDDLQGTSLASTADPTASLQLLGSLTGVQKTGTEQVRGVNATRYEGTLDPKKAIADAEGARKQQLETSFSQLDVSTVPVSVWLDDQGRVLRYLQEIELPNGLKSTTTLESYDFGTPVDVEAPPASQVLDGAPLLQSLRGGGAQPPAAQPSAAQPPAAQPSPTG